MKKLTYNDFSEVIYWEFTCPYCGNLAQLEDEPNAGDVVNCPLCYEDIEIMENKR